MQRRINRVVNIGQTKQLKAKEGTSEIEGRAWEKKRRKKEG